MSPVSSEAAARVRADVAERQARIPLDEVKARALAQPSALDGVRALRGHGVAVIGGLAAPRASMAALAGQYELGGANVLSVPVASGRSVELHRDLREVRARVQVPLLCKDLVVTSYQLWEARAHGADLVLLTAALLEHDGLVSLVERAASLGMSAVVEVHDERELQQAVDAEAEIIAVDARRHAPADPAIDPAVDPGADAPVDPGADARLIPLIPEGIVRVAECAGAARSDLIACARAGADAVHVGGQLLAGDDPRAAIANLVSIGAHPALPRGQRQAA